MNEPIAIPPRAAQHIAQLIAAQQAAEQQLHSAVKLLAATLDAPDGWQVNVQLDGGMIFAPPAGSDNTGSE